MLTRKRTKGERASASCHAVPGPFLFSFSLFFLPCSIFFSYSYNYRTIWHACYFLCQIVWFVSHLTFLPHENSYSSRFLVFSSFDHDLTLLFPDRSNLRVILSLAVRDSRTRLTTLKSQSQVRRNAHHYFEEHARRIIEFFASSINPFFGLGITRTHFPICLLPRSSCLFLR